MYRVFPFRLVCRLSCLVLGILINTMPYMLQQCTGCWIDVSFPRRSCIKKAAKRHKTRNIKGTSNLRRRHASVVPFPGRVCARRTLLICCCMSCDCTIINDFPFRVLRLVQRTLYYKSGVNSCPHRRDCSVYFLDLHAPARHLVL